MKIDVPIIGEFANEHGGNPMRKPGSTHTHLLPDGAWYREIDDGLGTFNCHLPSDDPVECCKTKRLYAAVAYEQVRRDFTQLRAALQGLYDQHRFHITFKWPVDRYGPDPEDAPTALRTLHKLTVERHAALLLLEDELRKLARPRVNHAPPEGGYDDKHIREALEETRLDFIEV